MLRSRLHNKFLKTKTKESNQLYNKQWNLCVNLLRRAKRNYFVELDNRILKGNSKFWETVNIFRKIIPNESITTTKK